MPFICSRSPIGSRQGTSSVSLNVKGAVLSNSEREFNSHTDDQKSLQYGFESHREHQKSAKVLTNFLSFFPMADGVMSAVYGVMV